MGVCVLPSRLHSSPPFPSVGGRYAADVASTIDRFREAGDPRLARRDEEASHARGSDGTFTLDCDGAGDER